MTLPNADSVLYGAAGWLPSAVVAILSLWAFSDPYPDFMMIMLFAFSVPAITLWWLGRLIFVRWKRRGGPRGIYWGIEPMMLVAAFGILVSGAAFRLRFDLGERDLKAYVTNSGARFSKSVITVGTFRIMETDVRPGGIVRMITGDAGMGGMFDKGGIVYSPSGKPPDLGEDVYEHIKGPWWKWYQSW